MEKNILTAISTSKICCDTSQADRYRNFQMFFLIEVTSFRPCLPAFLPGSALPYVPSVAPRSRATLRIGPTFGRTIPVSLVWPRSFLREAAKILSEVNAIFTKQKPSTTTYLELSLFVPQFLFELFVQIVQRRWLTLRMQVPFFQRGYPFFLVLLLGHILPQVSLQLNAMILRLAELFVMLGKVLLQLTDLVVKIRDTTLPLWQFGRLTKKKNLLKSKKNNFSINVPAFQWSFAVRAFWPYNLLGLHHRWPSAMCQFDLSRIDFG